MKLAEVKNIFLISKLWKRSSAEVSPEDRQPRSAPSDHRSPKKSLLNHLKITKFQINYAKEYENEKQVVHYCTKYLNDFPTRPMPINDLNEAILLKPQRSTAWYCHVWTVPKLNFTTNRFRPH
ncbi:hypothetical protein Glove_164g63 [Diversispora epigaea]|uniref:Uncharacterized protein n=1 Tax=Diversispora epigaea TaxID=1348612 RepID=A0A397ITX4_9GLOM|nr:hypothetical protein Glove_164g63 [Diversispora epigaea]